jgi:WD40 repeat protein
MSVTIGVPMRRCGRTRGALSPADNLDPAMSEVFISYSRRNAPIVRRIHAALVAAGREPWIDWNDIPPSARWMAEIRAAIDAANDLVVVLSPAALDSETCRQEWEHAVRHNKRLIPVVVEDVPPDDVPEAVRSLNWIDCREHDDLDAAVSAIVTALDVDLGLVKIHTRVLVRAREWVGRSRDDSYLLRGADLKEALVWLTASGDRRGPVPSELHSEYVQASQDGESRELARTTRLYNQVLARQLAAQARDVERQNPEMLELSVLLAVESIGRFVTAEATTVLRELLPLVPRHLVRLGTATSPTMLDFSPQGDLLVTAAGRMSPREAILARSWEDYVDQADYERVTASLEDVPGEPSYRVAQLWDPVQGCEVARLEHGASVLAVAFARDARRLATRTSTGEVKLWSLETFDEVSGSAPPELDHDENERRRRHRLAVVPQVEKQYDLRDRQRVDEVLRQRGIEMPRRSRSRADAVAALLDDIFGDAEDFTNDGLHYFRGADSTSQPGALSMCSTIDHHEVSRITVGPGSHALAVHPAGRVVATASGFGVDVWDTASEWTALDLHADFGVERMQFSPDSPLVAAVEGVWQRARTRVWDLRTGSPVSDAVQADAMRESMRDLPIRSRRIGPRILRGRDVVVSWDTQENRVVVRAGQDGEPILLHESDGQVSDVRVGSRDSLLLVCNAWEVRVRELPDGRLVGVFRLSPGTALSVGALSPDGELVAAGDYGGRVGVWRLRSGARVGRFAHEGTILDAVFSLDSGHLITTSRDTTARVWDPGPRHVRRKAGSRGRPGADVPERRRQRRRRPNHERDRRPVALATGRPRADRAGARHARPHRGGVDPVRGRGAASVVERALARSDDVAEERKNQQGDYCEEHGNSHPSCVPCQYTSQQRLPQGARSGFPR